MDEDSSQSSRTSEPVPADESSHRESDSQITLRCDSDTELNAEDTLRIDDSEGEEPVPASTGASVSAPTLNSDSDEGATQARVGRKKISHLIDSDSEDEDGAAKVVGAKLSKIIDSDSSEGSPAKKSRLKPVESGSDSEEDLLTKQNNEINAIGNQIEESMNRLKSLVDSDSGSPEEQSEEKDVKKKKKKLKSKKERNQSKSSNNPKDLLASLNLNFSDDDTRSKNSRISESDEDSGSGSDDEIKKKKPTKVRNPASEKKAQRMSAKAAMEQMQVIQSESQRMAREAEVSVPYHRPKQHTLQEFLSRRTVFKPVLSPAGGMKDGRKRVAAAIKMNAEQLAEYAKQLEEREKEAIEFFKSETEEEEEDGEGDKSVAALEGPVEASGTTGQENSDGQHLANADTEAMEVLHVTDTEPVEPTHVADMEPMETLCVLDTEPIPVADTEPIETLRVSDTEEDPMDALINKTYENAERLLAAQATPSSSTDTPRIDYDLFAEAPPSKLAQKKAELLSTNASIPAFPTLKGTPDMLIDLDSGATTPKPLSGVDLLFQKFAKCSGKKAKPAATSMSILSTDKGVLELDTVSFTLETEQRDPNGKEPVPGAAYAKLQQNLREKMNQARREALRKRQEEEVRGKKIDDEEDDDLLDGGEKDAGNEEEEEKESDDDDDCEPKVNNDLLDGEAAEEDVGAEVENEENEDESSEESSEDEEVEVQLDGNGEKKKSRIIAAFADSDDEEGKIPDKNEAVELRKTVTEDLFSTQEDSEKFTLSDRNNLETGEHVSLLWKDTEDGDPAVTDTQADNDLLELCSGRFGDTQATSAPLFTPEPSQQVVEDSELMALCSGTFATQGPQAAAEDRPVSPEVVKKGKLVIASSDEEEHETGVDRAVKQRKKKRRNVNISDDEDEEDDEVEAVPTEETEEQEDAEPEEEEVEHFVDYDSEENEVEVVMTKKEKIKVANAFVENEAELSESEWGSADEDEKDLDRYDLELADEEQFDQNELQRELGQIHMRRMLEQDKKEVKTLQEIFFEDEEKDGVGRERQFRWRNVETTFSLDYDKKPEDGIQEGNGDSDEETELQWRKMRHERELLLKEKKIDLEEVNLSATLLDNGDENNSSANNTMLSAKRKITVIRTKKSTEANTPTSSPFLISKSTIVQGHKASFLSRDEETLNKLATLVKSNPDAEGASSVVAAKGRNFVFAALSPAVDKTGAKRSIGEDEDELGQSAKKAKTVDSVPKLTRKPLLLGNLM